ncbi:MAG: hypothetical protein KKB79_00050 [Nanoarchaeota archaeon]|nr:hypothetical protein [Nanoarchaeota archaeon]
MFNTISKDLMVAGIAVAEKVGSLPWKDRVTKENSMLKGKDTATPDAIGEKIAVEMFEGISDCYKKQINLILDPNENKYYQLGKDSDKKIWAYADPVDGTIKLAGLGSDLQKGIYRLGNDGGWGVGLALTEPTTKSLDELTINDFVCSAIIDGNPSKVPFAPENAYTQIHENGEVYSTTLLNNECSLVSTSTQTNLEEGVIIFDGFQAFDRKSAPKGAGELAGRVWSKLANRNEGGAFDLWRTYGNISSFLKNQLGVQGVYESQGVAHVTINENLSNLIPLYWINKGAGGYSVDFEGRDLGERKLTGTRPNVILAANKSIKRKILNLISECS